MQLKDVYRPIKKELREVERVLEASLRQTNNESILNLNRFLLESPGKRLRPALVILSARATNSHKPSTINHQLIKIASAIELIHMASLIHDDVIDHSNSRHHRPTVNSKWGQDVSIALGDYLYSLAFKLISTSDNPDILGCISSATKSMCEGELIQVIERDNLSLMKRRYILIVKKKTAGLFAASCQAGAIAADSSRPQEFALKQYGLNFGIAFQIIDDYLDLASGEASLGKAPGQDIAVGETTLPLLNLLESVSQEKRRTLRNLLKSRNGDCLKKIRAEFVGSEAPGRTKRTALFYIDSAKEKLKLLSESVYRKRLFDLGDLILRRGFS